MESGAGSRTKHCSCNAQWHEPDGGVQVLLLVLLAALLLPLRLLCCR